MDRWIIALLGAAVALLLADKFVLHKDADLALDKSVAVLPLVNESGDPQQDYFSDGLSMEELHFRALAQVHDLKVIGRGSVVSVPWQAAGRHRDDRHEARRGDAAGRQRAQARQSGAHRHVAGQGSRWKRAVVSGLQSRIERRVRRAKRNRHVGCGRAEDDVTRKNRQDSRQATERQPRRQLQRAMLQGRVLRRTPQSCGLRQGRGLLSNRRSSSIQAYAMAYARLAMVHQVVPRLGSEPPGARGDHTARLVWPRTRRSTLAPQSAAVALAALGEVQAWSDFDFPAAEATLKQALAFDPDSTGETLYRYADALPPTSDGSTRRSQCGARGWP